MGSMRSAQRPVETTQQPASSAQQSKFDDFETAFYNTISPFDRAMYMFVKCCVFLPVQSGLRRARIKIARCHGPGAVTDSRTMQLSYIADAIPKFVHITHECMDSTNLIM